MRCKKMNAEKKKYIFTRFLAAGVALVLLAVILYLLLRPVTPGGLYVNEELQSSVEFGEDLSVIYISGGKTYSGKAVKRGDEYRAAVSSGEDEFVITIKVYKGYIELSDGLKLDKAVFGR